MIMRHIFIWLTALLALCGFVSTCPRASASVTKAELIASVDSACVSVLTSLLTSPPNDKESPTQSQLDKIQSRCDLWSHTLDGLPVTSIDDQLASWIEVSLVAEIRGLGVGFLYDPAADGAFESYLTDTRLQFKTLTEERGKQLLTRRNYLISAGVAYQGAFESALSEKLESAPIIEVRWDSLLFGQVARFVDGLRAMDDPRLLPLSGPSASKAKPVDLRDDKYISGILTLGLIRLLKQREYSMSVIDWYSYSDITSPAFFKDDPRSEATPRKYADVAPQASDILADCIYQDGGITVIQFDRLWQCIGEINLTLPFQDVKGKSSQKSTDQENAITFTNDVSCWTHFVQSQNPIGLKSLPYVPALTPQE